MGTFSAARKCQKVPQSGHFITRSSSLVAESTKSALREGRREGRKEGREVIELKADANEATEARTRTAASNRCLRAQSGQIDALHTSQRRQKAVNRVNLFLTLLSIATGT